jgi:mannosyl-oligosaccharide alpha-1,3-glucosidase
MLRPFPLLLLAATVCVYLSVTSAVDKSKFRTCKDTGFCRRYRKHVPHSHYHIDRASIVKGTDSIQATLKGGPAEAVPLPLTVSFYDTGVARVRITDPAKERWQPPEVVLTDDLKSTKYSVVKEDGNSLVASYTTDGVEKSVHLHLSPFKVEFQVGGETMLVANGDNMFHFEHTRSRGGDQGGAASSEGSDAGSSEEKKSDKKIVDYNEHGHAIYEDGTTSAEEGADSPADPVEHESSDGAWEESFGGHTDSKPFGPQSVGVDLVFPNAQHVYGIPEHATDMSLKDTVGQAGGSYSEPYRLYNLDVFEYELDVPMALYGSIPFMVGHGLKGTVGAFWFNPTETFIDVEKTSKGTKSHWISEAGLFDLFLVPGPSPLKLYSQYAKLTGTTQLPPMFALGYHQCRWNYRDEADVALVDGNFEEHNMPYDVLWLDIEHTKGKRYFTWDKNLFPEPKAMIEKISAHGRKMVTIVDPHLKRESGYHVYDGARAGGHLVQNKDGGEFDGWCWPGSSVYLDFTNKNARSWWADQFALDKYEGSTLDLYTWNDMNEPSVFNGPEVSMQKDVKAVDGQEHREWHNLYGFYQQMATGEGHIRRSEGHSERPFVLSRAFFAGSQRFGAIWTGDNAGQWSHLKIAGPMLLSFNIAGLPFIGSDAGGFFGNPDAELMTRWFQAAAYHPFFRGHAHHDAKRREPYVFGEPHTSRLRAATIARYALLPLWYTLFHESHETGAPVMRALWMQYPDDEKVFGMDDQFLVGSDLLVKPVTEQGATSTHVYLPGGSAAVWYDVDTFGKVNGGQTISVNTPIEKIPVYQRGGSIVPRQLRVRRSSKLMQHDPYTLFIGVDANGQAAGNLYLDDFHTFDYQKGVYALRHFEFDNDKLSATNAAGKDQAFTPSNKIERIVIFGLKLASTDNINVGGRKLEASYNAEQNVYTIRKPMLGVADDWVINF